jgi:hypothetical protein
MKLRGAQEPGLGVLDDILPDGRFDPPERDAVVEVLGRDDDGMTAAPEFGIESQHRRAHGDDDDRSGARELGGQGELLGIDIASVGRVPAHPVRQPQGIYVLLELREVADGQSPGLIDQA